MCIINDITHFVKNGVSVLRSASSNKYKENSPEIEALKHEFSQCHQIGAPIWRTSEKTVTTWRTTCVGHLKI